MSRHAAGGGGGMSVRSVFARLGVAVAPERAAAIEAEQDAVAARIAGQALRPAFEAEPADFQRAQLEASQGARRT